MGKAKTFLSLVALALLAACGPGAADEAPLRVDAPDADAARAITAELTAATLTALDAQGNVIAGLARSWRISEDGLSIVLRLRPAHFTDDETVTAADAVAAIEAARSGRAGQQMRDLLAGVTEVSSPLEPIVEIELSTPQPELLELLSVPQLGVRAQKRGAVAGPFTATVQRREPKQGTAGREFTLLQRNAGFHSAADVALAAAELQPTGADEAIRRFNRGETDLVIGGGLDGLADARVTAKRDALLLEGRRATLSLLVNRRHPLLGLPGVRRALQLAINRETLAQSFFGTQAAAPVLALSPRNIAGYAPPQPEWAALPFASRQLEASHLVADALKQSARAADAGRPVLTVAISDSPAEARLVEAIAPDIAAIGIDLRLARRSQSAHQKAVREGDFDLAILRRDTKADSPLPFLLPNLCNRNRQGICLPEADKLVAESWKAPTLATRMAMLAAAEKLWADDGAAIGLVQPIGWSLVSPTVSGVSANLAGRHGLRHVRIKPAGKLVR